MKPPAGDPVLRVADAIAEGADIDWGLERTSEPALEQTLKCLKIVQSIFSGYRDLAEPPLPPSLELSAALAESPPAAPRPQRAGKRRARPAAKFQWGPLQVLEPLGEGGFGEVYRAFDPRLDRDVALKLWRSSGAHASVERLLVEARRLARVRHPNVLVVHGADEHDGRPGMWTDLIEGSSLEQVLAQQGTFGGTEAGMIGIELCRALAAVHALGLVHRDVKTSNVMRERGGRIVLMDFGAVGELTASGAVRFQDGAVGTPLTLAPEQLEGEPATIASDVYGLGVLLYRLLTGAYPVEASSIDELRERHLAQGAVPLRDRRPDLSPALVKVIESALAPVEARCAGPSQLERALAQALEITAGAVTKAPRRRAVRPRAADTAGAKGRVFVPETLTRGVGREAELAACSAKVLPGQWLTVVAPAAEGKTRFALRLAEAVHAGFAGGACFVDIEGVAEATRLAGAIAAAAGLAPGVTSLPALVDALRDLRLLLVLDHCDRWSPTCAELAESLRASCAGVAVIATSRTALGVPHEHVHVLEDFGAVHARAGEAQRPPAPPDGASGGQPEFVGREDELRDLDAAAESARHSAGNTLFVSGEAGLGKSRLLAEARCRFEARGLLCLGGRCSYRSGRNFEPFIEALEEFSHRFAPGTGNSFEPAGARDSGAGALFFGLRSLLDTRQLKMPDPQNREQVWLLLDSLLKRIARFETLVLLIDDLQWADEGTLSLLNHVSRNSGAARLLVAGAFRPEDATADDPGGTILDVVRMLSSTGRSRVLPLARLDAVQTGSIVLHLLGPSHPVPASVARIHERAEGNPFFTIELVRLLAEDASTAAAPAMLSLPEALPHTISDAVLRRLVRLSREDRDLLEVAAVEGERFHARTLETASGLQRLAVLKRLRALEQEHHLVVASEDGHRFSHGLVREVVLRELTPELRRAYHDVVATVLIRECGDRNEYAGRIAGQLHEAQRHAEAIGYFMSAAADARRVFLHERALGFVTRALDAVARTPGAAALRGGVEREQCALLLLLGRPHLARSAGERALEAELERGDATGAAHSRELLGEAALAQGDLDLAERQLLQAREVFALASDLHPVARCDQKLGAVATRRGDFTVALERLHAALDCLSAGADATSRARVELEIGDVLYRRGDFERAIATFEAAVAAFRQLEERHDLARGLNRLGNALFQQGDTARARDLYEEALALASELDDGQSLARFRANLGNVHLVRGESGAALARYREALEAFESIGDRTGAGQVLMALGNVAFTRGRYAEAAADYRASCERREGMGDRVGVANSLDNLGMAEFHSGRMAEALAHFETAAGLRAELGDRPGSAESALNLGAIRAVLGDLVAAETALTGAARLALELGDPRRRVRAALTQACVRWWAGDRAGCSARVSEAEAIGPVEPAIRARILLLRGLLADRAGTASLHEGLALAVQAGWGLEEAHFRIALARAQAANDGVAAAALLAPAFEIARAGPVPLLELEALKLCVVLRDRGIVVDTGIERALEARMAALGTVLSRDWPSAVAPFDARREVFPLP